MVSQVGLTQNYGNYCTNSGANVNASELKNCLLARDKNIEVTENGNAYKKTNTNKVVGASIGVLTPLLVNIIKNKGVGGLLKNWKVLGLSCPALGLAGLALGALIDSVVNTKKAQKADEGTDKKTPQDIANVRLGVDTVA